jgi:hypothetical protein
LLLLPTRKTNELTDFIEKPNYFDYTTTEIKKHVNEGESYEKERFLISIRIIKCSLIKEFILWFQNQRIQTFNPYEKGKGEIEDHITY